MAHKPSLARSSDPLPPESAFHDDGSAFGGMSEFSSTSLPNSPTVNKEVELLGERLDGEPASFKRAPKKVSSWRSSVTSLATQRAVTRKLARRYWEKVRAGTDLGYLSSCNRHCK
ncbi:hypothetical protein DUNSADRAFT_2117 [Dunaliella salina]|uniref:Encoded protein n=1 Tax=Dunaliella salina TaxID=3046 RepID=A0ABQ7FWL3_DUNSA|nr:hypothetical protein DUNSADRAFT_2117 [Dunaliella salina]|eukprot:KAF5826761.1 hypothetical protein DUNSADRAFT_2117 [Dunaliella salina]